MLEKKKFLLKKKKNSFFWISCASLARMSRISCTPLVVDPAKNGLDFI